MSSWRGRSISHTPSAPPTPSSPPAAPTAPPPTSPSISTSPTPKPPLPNFISPVSPHQTQLSTVSRLVDDRHPYTTFFRSQIAFCLRSDLILCNTVEQVETIGMALLRKITALPVHAIGPLLPPPRANSAAQFLKWLAGRRARSVVYISYGTQNTITRAQLMAVAEGLELSGKDFIWVVRPPVGFDVNEEFREEWLPVGFEERMGREGRGMVVRRWAPQMEILSHAATGVFVSHCGWNSVVESLSNGVPIVCWPLTGDQFYNSKMMVEELKVGMEIARGEEEVEGREVARVIGEVMGGGEIRERVDWCKEKMREAIEEGIDVRIRMLDVGWLA